MKRRSVLIAALAAPSIVPAVALGQGAWPSKTVKFICPFAPGGGTDTVSRLMCDQLSKSLGQTFVVDGEGIIRYKQVGPVTPGVLAFELRPLLASLKGAAP